MGAFTDKTVLILGGNRSIDAVIIRHFIIDGTDMRFTYAGSKDTAKRLVQETGATAVFTGSADRDAAIDVAHKSGTLDILVVNTGIGVFGEALELNASGIDYLFKINIRALYHVSVETVRQMPGGEHILIIGSVNSNRMSIVGMAAYTASKFTLQGMARGLARDFGPRGIATNVVQPKLVDTGTNSADRPMRDTLHNLMAIKRHGQPEEVTGVAAWLAGLEASFAVGTMHTIDGAFGAQPTMLNQAQPLSMTSGFYLFTSSAKSGSR